MQKLRALWSGGLPLGEAFWIWVIAIGLLVNISSSVALVILMNADRFWVAILAGYALSVPYNVLVVVGLWRSAARYEGEPRHADFARLATVGVMLTLTLT